MKDHKVLCVDFIYFYVVQLKKMSNTKPIPKATEAGEHIPNTVEEDGEINDGNIMTDGNEILDTETAPSSNSKVSITN